MRKSTSNEIEHIAKLKNLDKDDVSRLSIELMLHVTRYYSKTILEMALDRLGYVREDRNDSNRTNKPMGEGESKESKST